MPQTNIPFCAYLMISSDEVKIILLIHSINFSFYQTTQLLFGKKERGDSNPLPLPSEVPMDFLTQMQVQEAPEVMAREVPPGG